MDLTFSTQKYITPHLPWQLQDHRRIAAIASQKKTSPSATTPSVRRWEKGVKGSVKCCGEVCPHKIMLLWKTTDLGMVREAERLGARTIFDFIICDICKK